MNKQRIVLTVLGTTALCAAAIAPARVGDGRMHFWTFVARNAQQVTDQAFNGLKLLLAVRPASHVVVGKADPGAGAVLGKPEATQDATDLKRAYSVAIANERMKTLGYDPAFVEEAIAAYRADNLAAGDASASHVSDPLIKTALEWVALREVPQKVGMDRLNAFAKAYPDWPAPNWLRHQMESRLLRVQDPKAVESFFMTSAPVTTPGKFALAKALKADGHAAEGTKLARAIFRESDLTGFLEGRLKADFGSDLTKGDYKYRADRLLYKEQIGAGLHYAALAGPDVLALEKARAAVIQEAPSDKLIAAVPDSLRKDPGLILAEVQKLRRADKLTEAAHLIQSAPRDRAQLIDGDEWWTERRVLARKLLDAGNVLAAYVVCATNTAVSNEARVEADFHAGWIALRFMNDPKRAAFHFSEAAKLAQTPTSVARIAYWQGRTAENISAPDALEVAKTFYRKAADHGSTYYGQLARQALGMTSDPVQEPAHEAIGKDRVAAVRVIELLYAAGEKEAAYALAVDAANNLTDDSQVAALATVIENQEDAHLALTIGKLVGQRGIAVDTLAFPTFGIPHYDPLENSASPSIVYSIARQESAFMPAVVSKAGAKGLMQMIDSTAKHTAIKAGLPFDPSRMVTDASFNARLGAAHLGTLLAEQGGSYILTFAAYNAGGGRVKQWIDAYGDPRKPGIDAIDWVERIPFTETRNYVQRVMANVTMYKAIFAEKSKAPPARTDHEAKL